MYRPNKRSTDKVVFARSGSTDPPSIFRSSLHSYELSEIPDEPMNLSSGGDIARDEKGEVTESTR
jgi:hypothetical protein